MVSLTLKCILGALIMLLITLLSKSKIFIIAALVPLFPTFSLIAHYAIMQNKGTESLREAVIFGLLALIPYCSYLGSVYFFSYKFNIFITLALATLIWTVTVLILIYTYYRLPA